MEIRTLDWDAINAAVENRLSNKTPAAKLVGKDNVGFWADFNKHHKDKLALLTDTLTIDMREKNVLTRDEELILRKAYTGLLTVLSLCEAEKKMEDAKAVTEKAKEDSKKAGTKVKRKI